MIDPSDSSAVGIVGLGDLGHAIASRFITAGWRVVVYDIRSAAADDLVARGAVRASSIGDLARRVRFALVVVLNDAQVNVVMPELLAAASAGLAILVHSSVLPATVIDAARAAASHGVPVLDAPVSGGYEKAELGKLTVMIGGEDAVIERCRPLLDTMANEVFHVGPVGAGSATKLANNLLSQGGYALQLEAMQLAAAYGVDEDTFVSVAVVSGGDSRGLRTWGRLDRLRQTHTLAGTSAVYDFLAKDVASAVEAAAQRDVILPIAAVAARVAPMQMEQRDLARPRVEPIPRCRTCNQELAMPYRAVGMHPECRPRTGS